MNREYTTYEQSKRLLELGLNPESADMWYQHTGISIKDGSQKPIYFPMVIRDCESDEDVPCWSVGRLLELMPLISNGKPILNLYDNYISYAHIPGLNSMGKTLIDSCVGIIELLLKKKFIK